MRPKEVAHIRGRPIPADRARSARRCSVRCARALDGRSGVEADTRSILSIVACHTPLGGTRRPRTSSRRSGQPPRLERDRRRLLPERVATSRSISTEIFVDVSEDPWVELGGIEPPSISRCTNSLRPFPTSTLTLCHRRVGCRLPGHASSFRDVSGLSRRQRSFSPSSPTSVAGLWWSGPVRHFCSR